MAWLYVSDAREYCVPVTVTKPAAAGEEMTVRMEDGSTAVISATDSAEAVPCNPGSLKAFDDVLQLGEDAEEWTILDTVRRRFRRHRQLYTDAGPTLISVNPNAAQPALYTAATATQYATDSLSASSPHVFRLANRAYQDMLLFQRPQSVLPSGESGAGKSFAAAQVLTFLATASHNARAATPHTAPPLTTTDFDGKDAQLLATVPLLQAFGNAHTARNPNASRMSVVTDVGFDSAGRIDSGSVTAVVLEPSRVVTRPPNERSFHIFYQLLSSSELCSEFGLSPTAEYAFAPRLTGGESDASDGSDDRQLRRRDSDQFETVRSAADSLGLSSDQQTSVLCVVAAVLHLGNIEFAPSDDGATATVCNPDVLRLAATSLQVDPDALRAALVLTQSGQTRPIAAVAAASAARDSLAIALYDAVFGRLVKLINDALLNSAAPASSTTPLHVSVIDGGGFEDVPDNHNSLPQLCGNAFSEQVQHVLNAAISDELSAYRSALPDDTVLSDVEAPDNQTTVDLSAALLRLLDSTDSDTAFLDGAGAAFGPAAASPNPAYSRTGDASFSVDHFAGTVTYTLSDMRRQNVLTAAAHVQSVVNTSADEWMAQLLGPQTRAATSAVSRFSAHTTTVLAALRGSSVHSVRCIKPDAADQKWSFHSSLVAAQLKHAELPTVAVVREYGFAVRRPLADFVKRYGVVAAPAHRTDAQTLVNALIKLAVVRDGGCVVTSSAVLIKAGQEIGLEAARTAALSKAGTAIRTAVHRAAVSRALSSARAALRGTDVPVLTAALANVSRVFASLPAPEHPILPALRARLEPLEWEAKLHPALMAALAGTDKHSLESVLEQAAAHNVDNDLVDQARRRLADLPTAVQVLSMIRAAAAGEDVTVLPALLDKADALGLSHSPDVQRARKVVLAAASRDDILTAVDAQLVSNNPVAVQATLARAREHGGLDDNAKVKALEHRSVLVRRRATALTTSIESANPSVVRAALHTARTRGVAILSPEFLDNAMSSLSRSDEQLQHNRSLLSQAGSVAAACASTSTAAAPSAEAALAAGLERADRLDMSATDWPGVARAKNVHLTVAAQHECTTALRTAVDGDDADGLASALSTAVVLNLSGTPEYSRAEATLLSGSLADDGVTANVCTALRASSLEVVEAGLEEVSLGLAPADGLPPPPPLVKALERLRGQLQLELSVSTSLEASMSEYDEQLLRTSLSKAYVLGLHHRTAIVDTAAQFLTQLTHEKDLATAIKEAIKSEDGDTLRALLAEAAPLVSASGSPLTGLGSPLVDAERDARAEVSRLDTLVALDEQLIAALDVADGDPNRSALLKLLQEAAVSKFTSPHTLRARAVLDRMDRKQLALSMLKAGVREDNLAKLNAAFEIVTELDLHSDLVRNAAFVRSQLQEEADLVAPLVSAIDTVRSLPAETLSLHHLKQIDDAMGAAVAAGVNPRGRLVREAKVLRSEVKEAMDLRDRVVTVLASGRAVPLADLEDDLQRAELLNLTGSFVTRLRAEVSRIRHAAVVDQSVHIPEAIADQLELAADPDYVWHKFPGFRPASEVPGGAPVDDQLFRWQRVPLDRSLVAFHDSAHGKLGVRVRKSVLGYCGELPHLGYPPMLAQDVIQIALEAPTLADEVYAQCLKQLTSNPLPDSEHRTWQLLAIVTNSFPPSREFLMYVINFLLQSQDQLTIGGHYSRYCLRRLLHVFKSGPSEYVPSGGELSAFDDRLPALVTVHLCDGSVVVEKYPVAPDVVVADLFALVCRTVDIGVEAATEYHFGLFVDGGVGVGAVARSNAIGSLLQNLPPTPVTLDPTEFVTAAADESFLDPSPITLVFKRELFSEDPAMEEFPDPRLAHLMYIQALDEIVEGGVPVGNRETAAAVVARALMAEDPDTLPWLEARLVADAKKARSGRMGPGSEDATDDDGDDSGGNTDTKTTTDQPGAAESKTAPPPSSSYSLATVAEAESDSGAEETKADPPKRGGLTVAKMGTAGGGDNADDDPVQLQAYIPKQWYGKASEAQWVKLITPFARDFVSQSRLELEDSLFREAAKYAFFGSRRFPVRKKTFPGYLENALNGAARSKGMPVSGNPADAFPNALVLAVDRGGVHLLHPLTGACVATFAFDFVYSWSGNAVELKLRLYSLMKEGQEDPTDELSLYTFQSKPIAALLVKYIHAVVG